jgi:hypothetical protein
MHDFTKPPAATIPLTKVGKFPAAVARHPFVCVACLQRKEAGCLCVSLPVSEHDTKPWCLECAASLSVRPAEGMLRTLYGRARDRLVWSYR